MNRLLIGLLAVLLGSLGLVMVVAVRRRNVAAAVNTLVSILVGLVSIPLAAGLGMPWDGALIVPELPLWVAVAGLLHSVGMLGPYDTVWWWDHLTHTVSAMLVAALLYAGVVVTISGGFVLSPLSVAVVTVAFTFAVGVFWEFVELVARAVGERYGVDPVLVHYGWRDTAFDLGFDLVGALVVVALDLRTFVELAARFPELTRALLGWTGGVATVGSMLMALFFGVRAGRDA